MSGFDSFKKAVGGGNKVGEEKSSGENHKVFPFSILKNFLLDLMQDCLLISKLLNLEAIIEFSKHKIEFSVSLFFHNKDKVLF